MSLLSEVPYASLLAYSPHTSDEVAVRSRRVRSALKGGQPALFERVKAVLRDEPAAERPLDQEQVPGAGVRRPRHPPADLRPPQPQGRRWLLPPVAGPAPRLTFDESEEAACSRCHHPLQLRRTQERRIVSVSYGRFIAAERSRYCPIHPELQAVRSQELAKLVAPGSNIAYDVLVNVGFARFLHCRQFEEIQADLASRHDIEVPVRALGHLARRFVAYVHAVHEESIPLLRKDMGRRGGYILHIDGTCEEGTRVLLVCMDSLSGQILDSQKITSENCEEVKCIPDGVRGHWGTPLGVVHDLRNSLIHAAGEAFPGVAQFVCHYHLAADVGKDILKGHVDGLRRLFRRTRLRPKLGALCRSLRRFAVDERSDGHHVVSSLLACRTTLQWGDAVTERSAQGAVHALASWILAFSRAGEGYGFPFELPYLVLYERALQVHEALQAACSIWPARPKGAVAKLRCLHKILATVVHGEHGEDLARIVAETRRDQEIFERFRTALRIFPRGGGHRRNDDGAPATLSSSRHRTILNNLRSALAQRARRDQTSAGAIKIVLKHLEKYWPFLFGHRLKGGSRPAVAPRTNNDEERLFRTIKRQCRRLHGRGHLSRDVDEIPAAATLVLNLRNTEYCQTVYGGPSADKVAASFSEVDPATPSTVMRTWKSERVTTRLPRKLECMRDLPRRLVAFLSAALRTLQA